MEKLIVKQLAKNSGTCAVGFKTIYEDLEVRVGDGCTLAYYSDREPATVVEIGKNYVKVQIDKATRIDNNGMSDSQEYKIERDENGVIRTFKRTRKGTYTDNGLSKDYGIRLHFGFRRKYYDYSF